MRPEFSQRRACTLVATLAVLSISTAQADTTAANWWWQTLGGSEHRTPTSAIAWHGRLMVIAWSVLIPVGIIVARFYKVTPRQAFPNRLDNQFWWITHQGLQYSGVLLTLIAIYLVTNDASGAATTAHAKSHTLAGWTLCVLCATQVIGAWLRGSKGGPTNPNAWPDSPVLRGDHYDHTRRRIIFEHMHVALGYLILALAVITTILGLSASAAPRWMWIMLSLWWILMAARFVQLQRRNTHVRTYHAIWGLAREHPGNRS